MVMKHKYLIIWLLGSTLLMAYILGNYYHQLGFDYPEWYSDFLMNTFKPKGSEDAYDLYTYSNFILSFIISCALATLFFALKKVLTKIKPPSHATRH